MEFYEVKEKMLEIAEVLKEFPEALQENAFSVLVKNLDINVDINNNTELETSEELDVKTIESRDINVNESKNKEKHTKTTTRKKNNSKESYQISKDLNLIPEGKQTFKEFYEFKQPKSSKDFNVVAIYYLEKVLEREQITIEDIYTCYKNANYKTPTRFRQSLADTSSKYGYISIDNNIYSVPIAGENYVEHDLPKNNNM